MFTLDTVVPWGRSFDAYRNMFALSETDLGLRILGCADGPASFNAEATRRGMTVISSDPIYRYDVEQLRGRIVATSQEVLNQTRQNRDAFVWEVFRSTIRRSIFLSHLTFCFFTQRDWVIRFIGTRFKRCAVWREKYASSRCWLSEQNRRSWSNPSRTNLNARASRCRLRRSPTSFSVVATK